MSVPTLPGIDEPDGDRGAAALGSSDMLRHAGVWMPVLACRECNGPALICRGMGVSADADMPLLPDGRLRPIMWLDGSRVSRTGGVGGVGVAMEDVSRCASLSAVVSDDVASIAGCAST